jgi:50S ribosomal subunit-associated GTPase HflX
MIYYMSDLENQKQSLQEFHVTDGKERDAKQESINEARELEDLLGIKDMNAYGTHNKELFASNLNNMSVAEMTTLASRVGLSASSTENKTTLKKKLLQSFEIYVQKHNVTVPSQPKPVLDPNAENYDEVKKLFEL